MQRETETGRRDRHLGSTQLIAERAVLTACFGQTSPYPATPPTKSECMLRLSGVSGELGRLCY